MTRNVGLIDRGIRLVLGILMLGLYGALDSPWRYVTLLGLVLIATSMTAACPIYGLLGWSTRKGRKVPSAESGASEGHSAAWWSAHRPSEDEKTWPPKENPSWRPEDDE